MRREHMSTKENRKRRRFTDEYKSEVVRQCQLPGKTIASVARELDLTRSAVLRWVRQAQVDAASSGDGPLTTAEREELSALRREVRTLRQEKEILKLATAFFAKEGTS